MAKIIARNAGILAQGRDVSGHSNSVTLTLSAEAPEVTGFADFNTRQRLGGGLKDVELSLAGYQDLAACQADELYSELVASPVYWGFYPEGAGASHGGYEFIGLVTNYSSENTVEGAATTSLTVSGVAAGSAGAASARGVIRGTSLGYLTMSGAGASTASSVDFSGSTASPWGVFRILTLSGTSPEVSACWMESGDDVTFTMAACFATASAANVVRAGSVSAGASRYQAVRVLLAGTSPCVTFTIMTGSPL